jgi:hypothetical protein
MKMIRPAEKLVKVWVVVALSMAGGLGCFSPLLAGIGGGTTLYQHETANKSSGETTQSSSSSKAKSKQSSSTKASDSDIE